MRRDADERPSEEWTACSPVAGQVDATTEAAIDTHLRDLLALA